MSTIDNKVPSVRLFYANTRLVCLIGLENTRLMRADSRALAQLQTSATLLQSDAANTVWAAHAINLHDCEAYSPYGFSPVQKKLAMVGFTGEWRDTQTGCYPLGNGYRLFSPSLRRLTGPDVLSPFDRGGLNAYAYCTGDPINYSDPSGQLRVSLSGMAKTLGAMKKTGATALLRENNAPMTLKPFIRHLAQEPSDVNALLALPAGNNHVFTKLSKVEGIIRFQRPDVDFVANFVPTVSVHKEGQVFAVNRGQLPRGVKGYEYTWHGRYNNTPLFAIRRPSSSSTDPSLNGPPPEYVPPPSYKDATAKGFGIRTAS